MIAIEPVAADGDAGREAHAARALARGRRRVVLVEEAVRVERLGTGDAARLEDAAELADVLLAAEADIAAAITGRGGIAGAADQDHKT